MKVIEYNQRSWSQLERRLREEAFPADKLQTVRTIVRAVRARGDAAVREFTLRFDGVKPVSFRLAPSAIRSARKVVTPELKNVFRRVEKNIRDFCSLTRETSWRKGRGDGLTWGEQVTPVGRAGIYIPGGKAPLVSSVFMTVVPARVAGVPRIILATPPRGDGTISPYIAAAADFLGVDEIYTIGGAQAIAALAFGTRSIPRVDKIVGPGNIYVTLAKKEVFGYVGIDSLAGPSEVTILADGTGDAACIAADLLAQAEHGAGGCSILITTSKRLAEAVRREADALTAKLGRTAALRRAFDRGVIMIRVKSLREGIALVNRIAPEHLEVMTEKPEDVLQKIRNAGAIFLGAASPVAAGDYVAGPSHVLPTGGSARFFSPLSVNDFLKKSNVIRYSRRSLKNDLPALAALAELEGLDTHSLSARIRFEE